MSGLPAHEKTLPAHEKTERWTLTPYDDLSNAFVFVREPPSVLILDRSTWLALELCTGHPADVAAARFAAIAGRGGPAERARAVFDRAVAGLTAQGLIRPTTAGVACA